MAQKPIIAVAADGTEHEFAPGTDPAVVDRVMADYAKSSAPPAGATTMAAKETPVTGRMRSSARLLPALGGMAGGIAAPAAIGAVRGAPLGPWGMLAGGVLGAAAGGGGMEAAREAILGQPMDPRRIASEAGWQAALEGGGQVAMRPLMSLARMTMRGALRPTTEAIRGFPDITETMLKERIPLGNPTRRSLGIPGGRTGGQIVKGARREASAVRNAMLDTAEQQGTTYRAEDLATHVNALINQVRRSGRRVGESLSVLERELNTFLRENPGQLTPNQVKRIKSASQDAAKKAYRATGKGSYLNVTDDLKASFDEALARGSREALEKTVPKMGKTTFAQAERRVGDLVGAQEAIAHGRSMAGRGVPAQIPLMPTFMQGMVPAALRSPNSASRVALFLNDPRFLAFVRQNPRLAAALFSGGAPPDQTTAPYGEPR